MSRLRAFHNTVGFIHRHPLGGRRGLRRFVSWQARGRFSSTSSFAWLDDTRLGIRPGLQGASGNLYCGLHELPEMDLVLGVLRPGDLFVDVGANIGSYTVIASGVCGASTVAIEPDPGAHSELLRNISMNSLGKLVTALQAGASDTSGMLRLTSGADTTNRIVAAGLTSLESTQDVRVDTLDHLLDDMTPTVMKIDVEGWEVPALRGASRILASLDLQLCIVEVNDLANDYGFTSGEVQDLLARHGFRERDYDPLTRTLRDPSRTRDNRVFVKDAAWVAQRLASAPDRRLFGHSLDEQLGRA